MKKNYQTIAFALLILGTLGLLLNEFVFAWGRNATLIFAATNLSGLLILGFWFRNVRSSR